MSSTIHSEELKEHYIQQGYDLLTLPTSSYATYIVVQHLLRIIEEQHLKIYSLIQDNEKKK